MKNPDDLPGTLQLHEFIVSLNKKDIISAFDKYYQKKHKEDPEGWPLEIREDEFQDTFLNFLTDEWGLRT